MITIKENKILLYCLLLILLLSSLFSKTIINLYAEDVELTNDNYSNVLYDLEKDPNFNISKYPEDNTNNSIQFVQIAESIDKELFIYLYQPNYTNTELNAVSININRDLSTYDFKNYTLTLINSESTLFKYKVDNFVVSDNNIRLYDISSVFRKFVNGIDEKQENNTISEIAFSVGKKFTYIDTSNGTIIDCQNIELINITNKYVGFVRYENGSWWKLWGESACDRHFVAFSTDKKIDNLLEADIMFSTQSYHRQHPYSPFRVDTYIYGQINKQYKTLTYSDRVEYDSNTYKYEWNRIESVNDFINSVNVSTVYNAKDFNVATESTITNDAINELKQKQWVLSFYESAYEIKRSGEADVYESTTVSDVTILRLAFETDGVYYNIGVIDNKQSGNDIPANTFETFIKLPQWLKMLIIVVLCLLLFPVLMWILYFIIKILVFLIKLIVKTIKKITEKIKKKKKKNKNKNKK